MSYTDTIKPAAAKKPVALPAAAFTGPVIALLVLAAGVIGIRDGMIAAGWATGTWWTVATVDWIDGLTLIWWMIPAGIAAIIVGVLFLVAALKPRRVTAIALSADTDVWIEPSTIARVANTSARSVPGVVSTSSTATRRTVTIRARVTGDERGRIVDAITEQVTEALRPLKNVPKVTVRSRIERTS